MFQHCSILLDTPDKLEGLVQLVAGKVCLIIYCL